jgi:DUF438 domain-containing protein
VGKRYTPLREHSLLLENGWFNLSQHKSLFTLFILPYELTQVDKHVRKMIFDDPNKIFAEVIIRWFQGTLDEDKTFFFWLTIGIYVELV